MRRERDSNLRDISVAAFLALTAMCSAIGWLPSKNCAAQAQSSKMQQSPVRTALGTDPQKIIPGKPFTLFIDFDMEPGWHIYYKDPGQSGMPTQVDWTLPPGFTAQALNWPPSETVTEAGIVTYGYSKKVRLSALVTPSKNLKAGELVKIRATAKWLACKHSCVPGNSSMSLDLKVQAK